VSEENGRWLWLVFAVITTQLVQGIKHIIWYGSHKYCGKGGFKVLEFAQEKSRKGAIR